MSQLIHVAFGNHLATDHVIAIASPNSTSIRRLVEENRTKGTIIDLTSGRRTKSVLFMDDGSIILAPITPETVAARATGKRRSHHAEHVEEE